MIWLPDWLSPKARRISARERHGGDVSGDAHGDQSVADDAQAASDASIPRITSADNIRRQVIEIIRPHITSGQCLVVTGYQDFFSSLAIILRELPDIAQKEGAKIRIAYGVDTGNARALPGRGRPVADEARLFFLERRGLCVEDGTDLTTVLAADAIRAGHIDLRVFDPGKAREVLGISGDRRLHAKIVVSKLGAVAGSANFSRAGLYHNIEYMDVFERRGSEEDPGEAAAKERQEIAEAIWQASVDWNEQALEVLDALLRPMAAEDAVARAVVEQKGFLPWRMDAQSKVTGRAPFQHQVDLVYETSSIVYEHGFAFLEAPTGSGKTDIGQHLGWTLSETFSGVVGSDGTEELARGGAVVIAPPRVIESWQNNAPRTLTALANTKVASRKSYGADQEAAPSGRIDQCGVLIIDESHTVTPGFAESSKRAEAIEFAPPSWNVCLSATLLGNKDVDWLAHLKEKRASIFMSPEYLQAMRRLFEQEQSVSQMMGGTVDADALSDTAREALSDMLAPFLAHRQRACIGERADGRTSGIARYPHFVMHDRPKSLSLAVRQQETIDKIVQLTGELAPGKRVTSVETSRFGNRTERRHNQNSLLARNLLNVLRANSAQALWQMEHGAIGRTLAKFEREESRKQAEKAAPHPAQPSLFDFGDLLPVVSRETPRCDELKRLLTRPEIRALDEKRMKEASRIQERHRRVVFLAERVDTLQIFAEELTRRSRASEHAGAMLHTNYVVSSDKSSTGGDGKAETKRALRDVCGTEQASFETITSGGAVEDYFREGGAKAPPGPASVFLTYQMAEGINLQSADALVLLGVTSNLKELIQGLGRIDRVDSPHDKINYYLIDIAVGRIASDEKVAQRLENYRTLSGRQRIERVDDADGDTAAILDGIAAYLREPRQLRDNNFHDVLSDLRERVAPARYAMIERAKIEGMWGAELALLQGRRSFTLLHLRGQDGRGPGQGSVFAPPRLLMIEEGDVIVRNQIACARALRRAYDETVLADRHRVPPDREAIAAALAALGNRISGLKEWDLRPERTVSLLQSLSVFLRQVETVEGETAHTAHDEAMFGDLGLRGLEYLAETWARLLDPYWIAAKKEVRQSFAAEAKPQDYISIAQIMRHLESDLLGREKVRHTMMAAVDAAQRMAPPGAGSVSERVAVAFISFPFE